MHLYSRVLLNYTHVLPVATTSVSGSTAWLPGVIGGIAGLALFLVAGGVTAAVIVVLCKRKSRELEFKPKIIDTQASSESEINSPSNTFDSDASFQLSLELDPAEKEVAIKYFKKQLPPRPDQANGGKYSVEDTNGTNNDVSEDITYETAASMSDIASGGPFAPRYPNSGTSAN